MYQSSHVSCFVVIKVVRSWHISLLKSENQHNCHRFVDLFLFLLRFAGELFEGHSD